MNLVQYVAIMHNPHQRALQRKRRSKKGACQLSTEEWERGGNRAISHRDQPDKGRKEEASEARID